MDFATAKLNFLGIFSAKNDFSPYFTFVSEYLSIFLLLKSLKMFFLNGKDGCKVQGVEIVTLNQPWTK